MKTTNMMMASIARRVATSSLCGMSQNGNGGGQTSTPNSPMPYPNNRTEKVRFGMPLESVCSAHDDIPSPLLVMILKLHKEAPCKKDVFRTPGNQASMKKLIQFLQDGRLVNIDNFSVHTIASVLKKFLRKIPSGVFGQRQEQRLFEVIQWSDQEEQCKEIYRIIHSLPVVTQRLLVLLFGTFRSIVDSSDTSMTSESLSISVAPSFFQSCILNGNKIAKLEDVQRFRTASNIMKFMIDNFGVYNLFGKENYDYYAKITRRALEVQENWTFTFSHPPEEMIPQISVEEYSSTPPPTMCSHQEDSVSSLANRSHENQHNNSLAEVENQCSYPRLSMSLEENLVKYSYNQTNYNSPPTSMVTITMRPERHHADVEMPSPGQPISNSKPNHHPETVELEALQNVNQYAESTKSLTFLPMVHERQTQRMKTRSEWFLKKGENNPTSNQLSSNSIRSQRDPNTSSKALIKKSSSKEKRAVRRTSSKKEKSAAAATNGGLETNNSSRNMNAQTKSNSYSLPTSFKKMSETDCTEKSIRQMNIEFTYKSRC